MAALAPDPLAGFLDAAAAPPAEFGMMPFWFWNDDLDEAELLRQLHTFHAGGFGGVVIHPRIGLSRRVGYLTPEYFRLVRRVVDECAALGMKAILYDEGSYPSGSACGRVVAENPDRAARALVLVRRELAGPWRGYWRPSAGRSLQQRLVSVVLARGGGAAPAAPGGAGQPAPGRAGADQPSAPGAPPSLDPATAVLLDPDERGLVRIDAPAGGWHALACIDVPSGGTIRGVHPEHEDGTATAPPAADLMNPDAVAAFLRLTHDAYAEALGGHLGTTVVAMFTDEPSPLGRGARRGAQPYTPGLEDRLAEQWGRAPDAVRTWLPALWCDFGPETEAFRRAYADIVRRRVREVFYGAQAAWCARHGIALTGHPADSDDMASLADFHWPGQDTVWRWVLPGGSGLQGAHSVAPKAATSAARAAGRRRVASELFGAYGWRLSLDEAKWLLDWHLARGNNLLLPHACFYSLRGGRAYESEPDVGLHNPWWPHFQRLARYARRLCWLLTDAEHVCEVAVVAADGGALPWRAARQLYERQVDFLYLDPGALERARVVGDRLCVGTQAYRAAVVDADGQLPAWATARLDEWRAAGGCVVDADAAAQAPLASDVAVEPPAPDLRVLHMRRAGVDAYLLFNEGEDEVRTTVRTAATGRTLVWDPLRETTAAPSRWPLRLPRREMRVLLIDPWAAPADGPDASPTGPSLTIPITDWTGRPLGDWTADPALERFSGTLAYTGRVALDAAPALARLDLGAVGEAAEVLVNGSPAGFALCAPHVVETPAALWRRGHNAVEVRVTNSAANAYEGAMRPSGLMGPVRLQTWGQ